MYDSDDWKVIDYTRKKASENMYLHIIERLESAIDNFQTHESVIDGNFNKTFLHHYSI